MQSTASPSHPTAHSTAVSPLLIRQIFSAQVQMNSLQIGRNSLQAQKLGLLPELQAIQTRRPKRKKKQNTHPTKTNSESNIATYNHPKPRSQLQSGSYVPTRTQLSYYSKPWKIPTQSPQEKDHKTNLVKMIGVLKQKMNKKLRKIKNKKLEEMNAPLKEIKKKKWMVEKNK